MKKIKPCPFCGAREELLDLDHSASHFFIVCTSCGAKGPLGGWSCINDAEDLWNKSEAARWRDRYADAMAKLARVAEWLRDHSLLGPRGRCMTSLGGPEEMYTTLDTLLSDTSQPLAVVEGIKIIDGETSHRRACVDAWLPGKAEEWPDEVYTLIVMPKEADNG